MKVTKESNVSLPKIEILNKLKKRKLSKKSNLKAPDISSYLRNVQVVPWTSPVEWDRSCELFVSDNFAGILEKILVWQARVPSLPVGVEGTLFLIQAMYYDLKCNPLNPDENLRARTLHALALIRFMNHISHLATEAVGGIGLPMFELASHMKIPGWLVNLRHQATHGGSLPTLESFQSAAAFMKSWLQENYWIPTGSNETRAVEMLSLPEPHETADETLGADESEVEENQVYEKLSEIISAYVASRVYHLRGSNRITDFEILKFWPNRPRSLPTKQVLRGLKHTINLFLSKTPSIACAALATELIPLPEFYKEFTSVFTVKTNITFRIVWTPILKLLQRKQLLGIVCMELAKIHCSSTHVQDAANSQRWSAIWIKRILLLMSKEGADCCHDLVNILPIAMKSPNPFSQLFLKRLLRLVKPSVGISTAQKIKQLGDIWAEPLDNNEASSKKLEKQLISLEEIVEQQRNMVNDNNSNSQVKNLRLLDDRGSEFWQRIPLGHVFT